MIFDIINDYNQSLDPFMENGEIVASKDELSNLLSGETTKEDLANLVVPVASDLINKKATLDSCYHENMKFFATDALIKNESRVFDIDENDPKTSKDKKSAKKGYIERLQKEFSWFYNQGYYSSYNTDIDVLDYISYKRAAINDMIKQMPLIKHDLIRSNEFYSLINYLILLVQSELIRNSIDENTNSHLIVTAEEPIVIKDFSDNTLNVVANSVMNTVCQALKSDSNTINVNGGK